MLKVKSIRPLMTMVVTTANKVKSKILKGTGEYDTVQKVLYIGDTVRGIEVGDLVSINPIRYANFYQDPNSVKANGSIKSFDIPTITINGEKLFKLQQADIEYVITEYEDKDSNIELLDNTIIN